jgi:hypothetical protein
VKALDAFPKVCADTSQFHLEASLAIEVQPADLQLALFFGGFGDSIVGKLCCCHCSSRRSQCWATVFDSCTYLIDGSVPLIQLTMLMRRVGGDGGEQAQDDVQSTSSSGGASAFRPPPRAADITAPLTALCIITEGCCYARRLSSVHSATAANVLNKNGLLRHRQFPGWPLTTCWWRGAGPMVLL